MASLEDAEGTSAVTFVENLIKTELGDSLPLDRDRDLGIEHAHRALAPKPLDSGPVPPVFSEGEGSLYSLEKGTACPKQTSIFLP